MTTVCQPEAKGGRTKLRVRLRTQRPTRSDPDRRYFGHGKAKLDQAIFTFSLPAGHSCPFADQCKAKADRRTSYLKDGLNVTVRCHAASQEARHRSVRESRWLNFELLRKCQDREAMVRLILD